MPAEQANVCLALSVQQVLLVQQLHQVRVVVLVAVLQTVVQVEVQVAVQVAVLQSQLLVVAHSLETEVLEVATAEVHHLQDLDCQTDQTLLQAA